jgi:Kdo2-lipid IVA lauroyltransferase/acyltransferase
VSDTLHTAAEARQPSRSEKRAGLRAWYEYLVRDPFFGVIYLLLHYLFLIVPTGWASGFGGFIGWLTWRFRHAEAQERISRMYATLAAGRSEAPNPDAAVRSLFVQIGRLGGEVPRLHRLWAEGRIAVVDAQHLLDARGGGNPVIVAGVHTGNWEVIGPTLTGLGLGGFKSFYQPPPNRFVEHCLLLGRRRSGMIPLAPGIASTRIALRHLADDSGVFLIFVDEERNGRVCGPLFGRPIPPRSNLANTVRLSWASGAAVIPAFVERLRGARFRTTFLPAVDLQSAQDNKALVENVHRLDRAITAVVLPHLDQWYMLTQHCR